MTTKFYCWLFLTEISKDCEIDMKQCVELNFIPQKGISLRFLDIKHEDDGGWDFEPHHVVYIIPEDIFECHGTTSLPTCSCTEQDKCCNRTEDDMKEHIKWLAKAGWEVTKIRRGRDRLHKFDGMFGDQPE